MAKFNLYTRADQSRDFQSGSLSSGYIYYDILGQEGSPDMARLRSQVSVNLREVVWARICLGKRRKLL